MKKRILTYINLLLGIASLSLAGCHTTKNAAKPSAPEKPEGTIEERHEAEVICLYGVPVNLYREEVHAPDTTATDTTAADTTRQEPPRIMVKYGVPNRLR